jgi:hypothetical protein
VKLRLKGDALRLRLTRGEVARLGEGGRVEEVTAFGPGAAERLVYAVEASPEAVVGARFTSGRIVVTIPAAPARAWAAGDAVGISATQGPLTILIEKDFACLDRRDEDADAFPHPGDARC